MKRMSKLFLTLKTTLHKIFSIHQTLTRGEYLKLVLLVGLMFIALLMFIICIIGPGVMTYMVQNQELENIWSIGAFVLFYISLFVAIIGLFISILTLSIQRLNDLDKSPWWVILLFIPFLYVVLVLVLIFIPGKSSKTASMM